MTEPSGVFDADTLDLLYRAEEVRIVAGPNAGRVAIIWVVVDGPDVFIRSFRGAKARWYVAATAAGRAVIEAGDRRIEVGVQAAADPVSVERASRAYSAKYRDSPYAAQMVRPDILPTTLRLVPS